MLEILGKVGGKKKIRRMVRESVNINALRMSLINFFNAKQAELADGEYMELRAYPNEEKTDTLIRIMVFDRVEKKYLRTVYDGWLSGLDDEMLQQRFDALLDNLIENMM